MLIRFQDMPVAFTAEALYQAELLKLTHRDLGRPLILLCQVIYRVAIGMIVAPIGVFYHALSAGAHFIAAACFAEDWQDADYKTALAWEHAKASLIDLWGITCAIPLFHEVILPGAVSGCSSPRTGGNVPFISDLALPLIFSETKVAVEDIQAIPPILQTVVHRLKESIAHEKPDLLWGVHAYSFKGKGAYSFKSLKTVALAFSKRYGSQVDPCNEAVLQLIEIGKWRDPAIVPIGPRIIWKHHQLERFSLNQTHFSQPQNHTPTYPPGLDPTAPTIAAVAALAFVLFLGWALLPSLVSLLGAETGVGLLSLVAMVPFVLFLKLPSATYQIVEERAKIEHNYATELLNAKELESALFWYKKAALDGYAPAQRLFGLCLLTLLSDYPTAETMGPLEIERVDEAFDLLHKAAWNGSMDARDDLQLMFGQLEENRADKAPFSGSKMERFKKMLGKQEFTQIAKTRLATAFQQSDAFIEGLLEPRRKEIAAIRDHVYQVTNQDSTDPHYGHFTADLARTVAEYATSYFY